MIPSCHVSQSIFVSIRSVNFIFSGIAVGGIFFVSSLSSYALMIFTVLITALVSSAIKTFVIFELNAKMANLMPALSRLFIVRHNVKLPADIEKRYE